jgi:hypothetical protein
MPRRKEGYSDKTLAKRLHKYKNKPNPILLKEYSLVSSDGEMMKAFDSMQEVAEYLRISVSYCRRLMKEEKERQGIRIVKLD